MNLSQRQMLAFLEVARLGSFTRAAERLHISQSGLSAAMRDLEYQLDCRLFDRTTRSVSLTAAGLQLVPVASRVLAELDSVSDTINQLSTRARQVITVGATPIIAASIMPPACQAFSRLHPEINIQLRDVSRQQIQDGVASGTLDAGFGAFFKPASGIERTIIAGFSMAYISRGKTRGKPTEMSWKDLRDKPLISLPPLNPVQQLIEKQLKKIGRGDEHRPVYENFQTMLAMVEAGFGEAILPSFIARACQRFDVSMSLLVNPVVSVDFCQITKKGRSAAAGTEALAAAIGAEFN